MMPYSRRAKFVHEHIRSARGMKRIRTVRVAGSKELRVGYDRNGMSHLLSVLTPKKPTGGVPPRWTGETALPSFRSARPPAFTAPLLVAAEPYGKKVRIGKGHTRPFRREEMLVPLQPEDRPLRGALRDQFFLQGRGRRPVGILSIERTGQPLFSHAQRHTDPHHHVGSCDEGCRAGFSMHLHRLTVHGKRSR